LGIFIGFMQVIRPVFGEDPDQEGRRCAILG
jgi:hypothetical protein